MLNTVNSQHDAHNAIRRHLAALGIVEPSGVTTACDLAEAFAAATTSDPVADLAADIIAGNVTTRSATKAVHAAALAQLTAERAARIVAGTAPALDRAARMSLADDAERILTDLRPVFDSAVAAIAAAIEAFGTPQPDKAVANVPALAPIHEAATDARRRLTAVQTVRTDIADCGYGTPNETAAWYVTTTDDLARAPMKLLHIIEAGIPVRLNTADETAAVAHDRDTAEVARLEHRAALRAKSARPALRIAPMGSGPEAA